MLRLIDRTVVPTDMSNNSREVLAVPNVSSILARSIVLQQLLALLLNSRIQVD